MAQVHEMIYMKMTNGEYVYGTNKAIGLYSVEIIVNANMSLTMYPQ